MPNLASFFFFKVTSRRVVVIEGQSGPYVSRGPSFALPWYVQRTQKARYLASQLSSMKLLWAQQKQNKKQTKLDG